MKERTQDLKMPRVVPLTASHPQAHITAAPVYKSTENR